MDTIKHEIPDDDSKIEITSLDSTTYGKASHELHFSPRVRLWLVIATFMSVALFLSFTFGSQLYSLVYRPQPPKIAANISPASITVQSVMNGVVYAVDPAIMMYAIRASTGRLIWQSFYPNRSLSTVSAGVTYTITASGEVSATRLKNNALLWSYQLSVFSPLPLTVAGNYVYETTPEGDVYALDAIRGSLLWQYKLDVQLVYPVLAAGKFVYINSVSGRLYTLLASKGTLLWQRQLPLATQLLTTTDTIIYFSASNINSLHSSNGTLAWHLHLTTTPVQALVMANGNIYVATFDNNIAAFRASDGSFIWHHRLPSLAYEPIIISDAIVYVHASDYAIYTLNASDGTQIWPKPVSNILTFAVVNKTAYIITTNNEVEALLPTGMSIWRRQLPSNAIGPLLVSDGVLYTGTSSGTIYAFRASDSALLWHYATQAAR